MEKINFINNSTPALNATNLNKLQDNVEDVTGDLEDLETSAKENLVSAINEAKLTGGDSLPIGSIVDYDGGTVPSGWEQVDTNPKLLWTNSSPTSDFSAQDVAISNLNDYDYIIVYARNYKTYNYLVSTQFFKGWDSYLCLIDEETSVANRIVTWNTSTNKVSFADAKYRSYTSTSAAATQNSRLVPVYIYGGKI